MHSLMYMPALYHWCSELASSNLWNSVFLLIMILWVQQILLEWSTKTSRQPFLNFYSLIFSFSHPPTHPPTASHLTLLSHASVNAFVEVLKASMLLYLMGPLWPDFSPVFTTVYITFPERTVALGSMVIHALCSSLIHQMFLLPLLPLVPELWNITLYPSTISPPFFFILTLPVISWPIAFPSI